MSVSKQFSVAIKYNWKRNKYFRVREFNQSNYWYITKIIKNIFILVRDTWVMTIQFYYGIYVSNLLILPSENYLNIALHYIVLWENTSMCFSHAVETVFVCSNVSFFRQKLHPLSLTNSWGPSIRIWIIKVSVSNFSSLSLKVFSKLFLETLQILRHILYTLYKKS